jgi:hypothetical protein
MKNGLYKVTFMAHINDCVTEEEGAEVVASLINDALEDDQFPEVEFELVEELNMEYNTDEELLPELNF